MKRKINVHHRPGRHCASTAIRDLVNFHGIQWSEAMCFGIGAGLGIWYLSLPGQSPSRMVHVRSADIESQFFSRIGVDFEWRQFEHPAAAEDGLVAVLDRNRPAIIQTDIFYLPYYNSTTHFPGHVIAVWGYDRGKGVFLATDTERKDVLEVPFESMRQARFCEDGFFRCQGNLFAPAAITPPENRADIIRSAMVFGSRTIIDGVDDWGGLAALATWQRDLQAWRHLDNWQWIARFAYQVIEKRGTGGGGFRRLYTDFLLEGKPIVPEIGEFDLIEKMADSARAWQALAESLKSVSEGDLPEFDRVYAGIEKVAAAERRYHEAVLTALS